MTSQTTQPIQPVSSTDTPPDRTKTLNTVQAMFLLVIAFVVGIVIYATAPSGMVRVLLMTGFTFTLCWLIYRSR